MSAGPSNLELILACSSDSRNCRHSQAYGLDTSVYDSWWSNLQANKNRRYKKKQKHRQRKNKDSKEETKTDLLTVVLCELVEESASLLGLEISQHGSDDGADVFCGKEGVFLVYIIKTTSQMRPLYAYVISLWNNLYNCFSPLSLLEKIHTLLKSFTTAIYKRDFVYSQLDSLPKRCMSSLTYELLLYYIYIYIKLSQTEKTVHCKAHSHPHPETSERTNRLTLDNLQLKQAAS